MGAKIDHPCAVSKASTTWAAYHAEVKREHWTDPAYTGPPAQGLGLEFRQCLGCGSHLAIEIRRAA